LQPVDIRIEYASAKSLLCSVIEAGSKSLFTWASGSAEFEAFP
jgi:hypothetical protein